MSDRYLIVSNNKVINICVWDGVTPWSPEDGQTVYKDPGGVQVGWAMNQDGTFYKPEIEQENNPE